MSSKNKTKYILTSNGPFLKVHAKMNAYTMRILCVTHLQGGDAFCSSNRCTVWSPSCVVGTINMSAPVADELSKRHNFLLIPPTAHSFICPPPLRPSVNLWHLVFPSPRRAAAVRLMCLQTVGDVTRLLRVCLAKLESPVCTSLERRELYYSLCMLARRTFLPSKWSVFKSWVDSTRNLTSLSHDAQNDSNHPTAQQRTQKDSWSQKCRSCH